MGRKSKELGEKVTGVAEGYMVKHKQNLENMIPQRESGDLEDTSSLNKKGHLDKIPLLKDLDSDDTEEDQLALNMLILQIELMGFRRDMIEALFEYEDNIEDANHAVELLIQGQNGWTHKFVKDPFTQLCKICKGYGMDH
jgi:hypothetical protein